MLSANGDDAVQVGDVEKLLTRGIDVLVIVPHDGKAMAKAVRLAHDAGVPVIAYDRLVLDSDLDLYVSFDNVRIGELQARYAVDHLPTPGRGRIVRIFGAPDRQQRAAAEGRPGPRARALPAARRHPGGARGLGRGLEAGQRQAHPQRGDHGARRALRRRPRQQRQHRRRRRAGAARGRTRRARDGHRHGRRDGRTAAHRGRHAGDDDLQAAEHAGARRGGAGREDGAAPGHRGPRGRQQWRDRRALGAVRRGHRHARQPRRHGGRRRFRGYDEVFRGIPEAARPPRP